jgi:hypothetical protein
MDIRAELKWLVNAGAEGGLGVSVAGVDKHVTHSFSMVLVLFESTRD